MSSSSLSPQITRAFLDYITIERGLSRNTADAYAYDLQAFASFCEGKKTELGHVERRDILDFLLDGWSEGLEPTTLARRLVTLKMFFRFLVAENFLSTDPTEGMESPTLWKSLPDLLDKTSVDKLLNQPDKRTLLGQRDRILLEMMYACGLRVSELITLTPGDLHLDDAYIRARGKGRKERAIPIGVSTARTLQSYLDHVRPALLGDETVSAPVFVSNRGNPLTRARVWQLVKQYARDANLPDFVHPHTLRHSFASHLLSNEAPLRIIQEMLGHADISTTQTYTHVDQNRLKNVHNQFHPRP